MDTLSINDLKNFEINIDFFSLIISILTSAICAYLIKFIYIKFAKSINNKENFSDTFVLLAITTTVVITVAKVFFSSITRTCGSFIYCKI